MEQELRDIVNRSIKGEKHALKQLYDACASQMLGVCMRYTHSRDEAQDLLHDGFIKVYQQLGSLRNVETFDSWIYKIMVNTAINYLQRKSSRYEKLMPIASLEDKSVIDYDQYDTQYLLTIIQQLPERMRAIFNMHEIDGYSFQEIAAQFNITESSVRSCLSRARQMIQENLKNNE